MKIGIIGDVHFCQYSSIIRSRGQKFSTRLENCIKSINWAEKLIADTGCELTIYCGDFFDRSDLIAEEISALKEIDWNNTLHYAITGNHELGSNDLSFNSADALAITVIKTPKIMAIDDFHEIAFLPYILESNRQPLIEYFPATPKHRIIISHNDLLGVQMGQFISKSGFSIDEIENNCDKCINGHLHNGMQVSDKIINIGNLTGQNFSEDATKYDHCIFILDTDTMGIDVFENPFAFNFYKFDATKTEINLNAIKNNSIITLKCFANTAEDYRNQIKTQPAIVESRLILQLDDTMSTVDTDYIQDLSVDHLSEFRKFILDTLGNDQIIMDELNEVCK